MAHQSLSCQETGSTVRTTEFALKLLERITNHFSEESIIGRGGSGIVYKGVLDNGEEIAIKKLYKMPGLDDKEFTNEFNNLMRARHKNIMRLIGYCYSLAHECLPHDGKYVFALLEERLLCYEYLHGGSLDERLSDESCGLDWHKRFTIIKGVCEGLNFLHNIPEGPIYHLDLKPANVLLDNNMLPKIGDFGLSRLFTSAETQITTKIQGTPGYMPPEYIERGEITSKFDIFSLGVIIIQVIAGREGYVKFGGMAPQEFSKLVHENWAKRRHATMSSRTWQEIKTCMDMALKCVETDGVKRPYINEIIDKLSNIGSGDNTSELDKVDGDIVNEPAEKSGGDNNVDEQHKVDDDGDIVYKLDKLDTDHIADEDEDKLDAAKSSPMGQSPRCHGRQGCRLLPTDRMDSLFSTRCVWVNGPVIVGGGPSGLAVAAALREQGTPFVVLEREDCIASLWQKRTYHNLKLNWAKQLCELPRMPFPDDYPEYLTCRQFIDYLETYACKFDVKPLFNTTVLSARYDESFGLWRVRAAPTQGDGAEMEYISRWLVVATSQNAEKIVPCIPGLHSFRGEVIHSSDYRSGEAYKGKRVLVVGCGHSGMEVSLDLCDNAAIPFMVVRDVLGFSTLCLTVVLMRWLPLLLLDKIMLFLAWLLLGELSRFGIRTPAVDPLTLKKTYGRIWCSTARKIRSSEMNVVPGVMRFTKSGVELSDGIFLDVDAVVLATGYHTNVPQWLQGTDFPSNGWKGQNGLFSVGFSGASADAMCIAKDLGHLWKEETVRNKQKCAVTRWRRSDQTFGLAKPIAWKL